MHVTSNVITLRKAEQIIDKLAGTWDGITYVLHTEHQIRDAFSKWLSPHDLAVLIQRHNFTKTSPRGQGR